MATASCILMAVMPELTAACLLLLPAAARGRYMTAYFACANKTGQHFLLKKYDKRKWCSSRWLFGSHATGLPVLYFSSLVPASSETRVTEKKVGTCPHWEHCQVF